MEIDPFRFAEVLVQANPKVFQGKAEVGLRYKLYSLNPPLFTGQYSVASLGLRIVTDYFVEEQRELISYLELTQLFKKIQTLFPESFLDHPLWQYVGRDRIDDERCEHEYYHDQIQLVDYPSAHETLQAQLELEQIFALIK